VPTAFPGLQPANPTENRSIRRVAATGPGFPLGQLHRLGLFGIAFAPGVDREALWPEVARAIDRAQEGDEAIGSAGIQLVLDISRRSRGARHLEAHRFRR
jgi:hypothetical protein